MRDEKLETRWGRQFRAAIKVANEAEEGNSLSGGPVAAGVG